MKRPENTRPFAKKSLGQNFLTDPNSIKKIVEAVEPSPGVAIIEIGPGRGALTEKLVESGASVAAIELDRDLARALSERASGLRSAARAATHRSAMAPAVRRVVQSSSAR